jgi:hypothetical protein
LGPFATVAVFCMPPIAGARSHGPAARICPHCSNRLEPRARICKWCKRIV